VEQGLPASADVLREVSLRSLQGLRIPGLRSRFGLYKEDLMRDGRVLPGTLR
jgi:hypothetical protein